MLNELKKWDWLFLLLLILTFTWLVVQACYQEWLLECVSYDCLFGWIFVLPVFAIGYSLLLPAWFWCVNGQRKWLGVLALGGVGLGWWMVHSYAESDYGQGVQQHLRSRYRLAEAGQAGQLHQLSAGLTALVTLAVLGWQLARPWRSASAD